ncbi:class I SAM-dependent methyltransferase [bacterium]|nr:class I SAM-dependent methyltransferase [bacterium]
MSYIDETLIFESDKIYYKAANDSIDMEVMMDWEDAIMKKSADYVCKNGGDILEIGFGMGIAANYIQANSINSHTIVENHPQIIEKAKAWAADKPNVNIIESDWNTAKDKRRKICLATYDGIFYDTFADDNMDKFKSSLANLANTGCKVTWWNSVNSENNYYNITGVTYEAIAVSPPPNCYFNHDTYYLPKKEF